MLRQPPASLQSVMRSVLAAMTMSVLTLWLTAIVCTRLYVCHNAYIHHRQTVEDDKWSLENCQKPSFRASLKHRSNLCQEVEENAQKWSILVALNETMSVTSMCGTMECAEVLAYIQNGGLSTVTVLSVVGIALVAIVIPAANIVTRWLQETKPTAEAVLERGAFGNALIPAVREHDNWIFHHAAAVEYNQRLPLKKTL